MSEGAWRFGVVTNVTDTEIFVRVLVGESVTPWILSRRHWRLLKKRGVTPGMGAAVFTDVNNLKRQLKLFRESDNAIQFDTQPFKRMAWPPLPDDFVRLLVAARKAASNETFRIVDHVAPTNDVNHPSHYGGDTPYETIKVLEAWLTRDELAGFLKGNAIKYLSRAGKKDGEAATKDYAKAAWYTDRLKSLESKT